MGVLNGKGDWETAFDLEETRQSRVKVKAQEKVKTYLSPDSIEYFGDGTVVRRVSATVLVVAMLVELSFGTDWAKHAIGSDEVNRVASERVSYWWSSKLTSR